MDKGLTSFNKKRGWCRKLPTSEEVISNSEIVKHTANIQHLKIKSKFLYK